MTAPDKPEQITFDATKLNRILERCNYVLDCDRQLRDGVEKLRIEVAKLIDAEVTG